MKKTTQVVVGDNCNLDLPFPTWLSSWNESVDNTILLSNLTLSIMLSANSNNCVTRTQSTVVSMVSESTVEMSKSIDTSVNSEVNIVIVVFCDDLKLVSLPLFFILY